MELNENPISIKTLPFQAAANDDAAGAIFYSAFKERLADIQRVFTQHMTGVHAVHWVRGNRTGFHLYTLDPKAARPEQAMVTIFQETFHAKQDGRMTCVRGGLSWRPDQQEECFSTVQHMIIEDLYHYDQKRVRIGVVAATRARDKSPCL